MTQLIRQCPRLSNATVIIQLFKLKHEAQTALFKYPVRTAL